jgi:hypothetical protein
MKRISIWLLVLAALIIASELTAPAIGAVVGLVRGLFRSTTPPRQRGWMEDPPFDWVEAHPETWTEISDPEPATSSLSDDVASRWVG